MELIKKIAENSAKSSLEGRYFDSDGNWHRGNVSIDGAGNQAITLSDYKISNIDADASPNFYGFERADGAWYILKETLSVGSDVYEYLTGASDLASTWANRTSETYDTFANTF